MLIALPKMSEGGAPDPVADPLARLGERLDRARAKRGSEGAAGFDDPAGRQGDGQQGAGLGLRIGVEFVVAVVVATGLGWALDRWLGTRPWGTIVLFFLGVAAGMLSVYRAITGIKMAVGYRRLDGPTGRKPAKDAWDEDEE